MVSPTPSMPPGGPWSAGPRPIVRHAVAAPWASGTPLPATEPAIAKHGAGEPRPRRGPARPGPAE